LIRYAAAASLCQYIQRHVGHLKNIVQNRKDADTGFLCTRNQGCNASDPQWVREINFARQAQMAVPDPFGKPVGMVKPSPLHVVRVLVPGALVSGLL
jgi:hypothetical protein